MPIYEYRCAGCGAVSDFMVGVGSQADAASLSCGQCGGERLERLMSRINIGRAAASFAAPCGQSACDLPPAQRAGCCGGACHGH
jgi:putative FmdB family regulatory protein